MGIESQVVPMSSEIGSSILKDSISIKPGITQKYKITITFIETGDSQNYNQGKIFNSKIQINESVESNLLVDRIFRDNIIYSDNVASEYVTSILGINFGDISSETNGLGVYYIDAYTTADNNVKGNGLLMYPIGLLTADDISFAGGSRVRNSDSSDINNSIYIMAIITG